AVTISLGLHRADPALLPEEQGFSTTWSRLNENSCATILNRVGGSLLLFLRLGAPSGLFDAIFSQPLESRWVHFSFFISKRGDPCLFTSTSARSVSIVSRKSRASLTQILRAVQNAGGR